MKKPRINSYLSFKIHSNEYAIHVSNILNIIDKKRITSVPEMPDYMRGIIKYRRKTIPIVDLSGKLGLGVSQNSEQTCFIVVKLKYSNNELYVGLIVDEVISILEIKEVEINMTETIGNPVKGTANIDKYFIKILDLYKVFNQDEIKNMAKRVIMKSEAA